MRDEIVLGAAQGAARLRYVTLTANRQIVGQGNGDRCRRCGGDAD
jgi:hypothetical protein